jgi:hypothetical protein
MPTPANRTPIRVARGTYTNLNSSLADIQEGEICYATDQDKLYVKEGGSLVSTQADVSSKADIASPTFTGTVTIPSGASIGDIGTTIQAFDADTAKTDVEQLYTAGQRGQITELSAGTSFTIDLDASNNFLIQPNGTYTVTLSNISGAKGQCGSIFIKPTAAAASGSFPTTMKFVGGAAGITLTGTSGAIDRIDYIVQDDSAGYECLTCNFTANYVS